MCTLKYMLTSSQRKVIYSFLPAHRPHVDVKHGLEGAMRLYKLETARKVGIFQKPQKRTCLGVEI